MVDPWLSRVYGPDDDGRPRLVGDPDGLPDPKQAAERQLRAEPVDWPEPPPQKNDGVTWLLAGVVILALVAIVVAAALLQDIFR